MFSEQRTFGTTWIRLYFTIENGLFESPEVYMRIMNNTMRTLSSVDTIGTLSIVDTIGTLSIVDTIGTGLSKCPDYRGVLYFGVS